MAFSKKATAQIFFLIGFVIFVNSIYSTYQFNQLSKFLESKKEITPDKLFNSDNQSNGGSGISTDEDNSSGFFSIPIDIKIEPIIAAFFFLAGSFYSLSASNDKYKKDLLSNKKIKNFQNRSLKYLDMSKATAEDEVSGFSNFEYIENSPSILDITQKRKEYLNASKDQSIQESVDEKKTE
ncbi:unnamed protein product [[Candida] boidinii]|uniref:Unnamed protein product n=1 Tax=Candida boidinii TaxID=5477 RepID=A0A9W6WFP2_CANBO|nr:hypothetical protein B5S30_g5496 [[Candida] boidinii]OWB81570.1 hypothetical protein B5S33_g189 [[Candida] boidinii]GME69592.1 unnamed protein product [[Candida] boidinii]GME92407.1 unnamed protein product [[Candida] boidinii]GMF53568.1 unnamed protein product [[Candida] boidinii]